MLPGAAEPKPCLKPLTLLFLLAHRHPISNVGPLLREGTGRPFREGYGIGQPQ